jgi:hypothetical protein
MGHKKLVPVKLKELGFKELEGVHEFFNSILVEEDMDIKEYAKEETAPYGGEAPSELFNFIDTESPEDEYLRVKRDTERELMYIKEKLNSLADEIKSTVDWINHTFNRVDEAYKNQIDNGSPKEDNIHIS